MLCVALTAWMQVGMGYGQQAGPPGPAYPAAPPPAPAQAGAPLMTPEQLDDLVAPVALYPDPLLGQVLAASTYPLEIVEAERWLQQNRSLQGAQLMAAAKQQNWDPSVQALVAFPDVLNLLNNDLQWTTNLGNAFLAQQADVMAAVQTMRERAKANGHLNSTPQEVVTTDTQNGQSAIEIQPANPQVMYVPVYQPEYVYGPPAWGAYPDLWYPPDWGYGFGFLPGIYIGAYFPGWWGWGGWGWGCGWFGNGLFVNVGFFNRWGFAGRFGGAWGRGFGAGRAVWAHDPVHRMGVAYSNAAVANRFGSNHYVGAGRGGAVANRGFAGAGANRGGFGAAGTAGRSSFATAGRSSMAPVDRGNVNGWGYGRGSSASSGYRAPAQSYRGSTGMTQGYRGSQYAAPRSYAAPSRSYAAPSRSYAAPSRSYAAPSRSYAAPSRSYAAPSRSYSVPSRSYSAPRSFGGGGGGHSFGGGGGHSFGGGGGHAGGGGHGGGRR